MNNSAAVPLLTIFFIIKSPQDNFIKSVLDIRAVARPDVRIGCVHAGQLSDEHNNFILENNVLTFIPDVAGIDYAIACAIANTESKYIWFFGDDRFDVRILPKLCDFLYLNSPGFIYLTDVMYSQRLGDSLLKSDFLIYDPPSNAFLELQDQLGFLSSILVSKKNATSSLATFPSAYMGLHWLILYISINSVSISTKCYRYSGGVFLSEPKPSGENRWYDSFETHAISFKKILSINFSNINILDKKYVVRNKFIQSVKAVIYERAHGYTTGFASSSGKIIPSLKHYYMFPSLYVWILLLFLPRTLLTRIRKILILSK